MRTSRLPFDARRARNAPSIERFEVLARAELLARTLGVELGVVGEWVPEEELVRVRAFYGPWRAEALRDVTSSTAGPHGMVPHALETPVVVGDPSREIRFTPREVLMKL